MPEYRHDRHIVIGSGRQLGKRDHAGVRGSAEIVADAVLLCEGLDARVELSGQCVRFGIRRQDGRQRTRQFGGRTLPSVALGYQFLHGSEQLVRTLVRTVCAVLDELPALALIKFQLQPEIRYLASGDIQRGLPADAGGLLQYHGPVRTAEQTVGAGDLVEGIVRFLLARMMHQQDAYTKLIGDPFDSGYS